MNDLKLSLRPANPDDLPQILKIESVSYPAPWNDSQFHTELKIPYSRFYVLTDDETDEIIFGYMIYYVQAEGVSLLNIALHPDVKGLGYAKKLMRTMINEAVRDEIPRVSLEVRASNAPAIRLYLSLGFKTLHERKNFYQNGETALIMELKTSDLSGVIQ